MTAHSHMGSTITFHVAPLTPTPVVSPTLPGSFRDQRKKLGKDLTATLHKAQGNQRNEVTKLTGQGKVYVE